MQRLTADESAALGLGTTQATATVAGWGDTDPDVDDCCYPSQLQSASVPVQTTPTCQTNLRRAPFVSFDVEYQLCAGRLQAAGHLGTDTCQGDSGGPIIVDVAGTPRIAGVTSFGVGCGQQFFGVYARTTALAQWLDSVPGIPADDPRDPSHGPGDVAAPVATGQPYDYDSVRIQVTAPTTGPAPTSYTVWARDGRAVSARDIYLGRTELTDFVVDAPPTNSSAPYQLLVRPYLTDVGDGPTASVRTRPVVDRVRPSAVRGLRVARHVASWRASADRQSGIGGYDVQRKVKGRWLAAKFVTGRSLRLAGHGSVRVRACDLAGNASAWSAAVSY
jgi:hypothetical protein